jgi:hypothetical protein
VREGERALHRVRRRERGRHDPGFLEGELDEAVEVRRDDHAHVARLDEARDRSVGSGRDLQALLALFLGRLEVGSQEAVALRRLRRELREQRRVGRLGPVPLVEPGGRIAARLCALELRDALYQVGDDLPAGGHAGGPRHAGTEQEGVGARVRVEREAQGDERVDHPSSLDRATGALQR